MNRAIGACMIILSVLALSCAHTVGPEPVARIPVEVRAGIVFVPIKIGQNGPYWFEVDSGFQNCAIDRALASRLGLRTGERQQVDAPGGSVERATISGAQLIVGGREIRDARISAIDLSSFGPFFGRANPTSWRQWFGLMAYEQRGAFNSTRGRWML